MKSILWFRRDLRVDDSLLLSHNGEVLPIFIFDKNILDTLEKNDKRVYFIFNAVMKLKCDLQKIGLDLAIFYSTPQEVFTHLKRENFTDVYASIDFDSYARKRDEEIGKILTFHPLNDSYIFDVHEVLKSDGNPYLVYTPYYKTGKQLYTKFHALSYVKGTHILTKFDYESTLTLEAMGFKPLHVKFISPEEKLDILGDKLENYAIDRDFLALDATSNLSVDLRFGTISIRAILRKLVELKKEGIDTEPFFRQLVFRDFYAYLLYHFPTLEWKNYKYETPTTFNVDYYERFCAAQTGYPLIDAAINELKTTGNMHNRARMVVGSFFTKHLLLPWQKGEAFFAKYLLDYDASANVLSWQWCAGTGIDPQPYFRIFNPYSQSKKFDKEAVYIKKWLPLLKDIDAKGLHVEEFLTKTNIVGYPKPIVKHEEARKKFLALFK
ncbi:MAG: deoxyribodipyrimidine photo-lyase [Campylobacteraceae bacterium]|nr:deoxyribodipyrimidine photo-lyase [Campylobacteraceae bacterium]